MEALMKAVEALKAALGKNPDHMKMYGPALDEMVKAVAAETEARAAEAKNAAPPPAKDAQPEPKDEEEAYAAEAMRYSSGKMTEGEKAMFEKWQGERMARKAIVARQLMDRKLAESGIPSQFHDELRIIMGGKTEKEMDTLIASRKALLESVQATRVPGAGAKGAGPETKTKIQESLAAAGLLKGGK